MITSLLLYVFIGFANLLLNRLSTGGFSTDVTNSLTSALNSVYAFNAYFPLDTLFTVARYAAIFWLGVYLWRGLKWLIHLIRGN